MKITKSTQFTYVVYNYSRTHGETTADWEYRRDDNVRRKERYGQEQLILAIEHCFDPNGYNATQIKKEHIKFAFDDHPSFVAIVDDDMAYRTEEACKAIFIGEDTNKPRIIDLVHPIIDTVPGQCTYEIWTLSNTGCQCGQFAKEMEHKGLAFNQWTKRWQ